MRGRARSAVSAVAVVCAMRGCARGTRGAFGRLGALLRRGELARKLLEHKRAEERNLRSLALPDQAVARKVEPLGERRIIGTVQIARHSLEELGLGDGIILVEVCGQLLVDKARKARIQG